VVNKSRLFTSFNSSRSMARAGVIDAQRLNKALGVAQTEQGSHIEHYRSTKDDCGCPDRRYRGQVCKGMLALLLIGAAS